MVEILITTYRGLSLVSGQITIEYLFELMRGNTYRDKIRRLREAVEEGDMAKADRMKKQLPYRTITTTYTTERLAYSLAAYQDIITLDCDDMEMEKLPVYRQLTNDCPDTLGDFISPREHGLKIFVYLTGEEADALRAELNAQGTVDYATLERYHHRMYTLARTKYEKLLGTKVDASGSDPGRGFFVSHDPDAFLSLERLEKVRPLTVTVTLPTKEECKTKKRKKPAAELTPLTDRQENASPIELQVHLRFRKAIEYARRKERFIEGNRDNFLYCLGNQCYRRHILEEEAISLVHSQFGDIPGFDLEQPIRNAYQYTTTTDHAEEENKEPKIQKIIRFMDYYYEIRRNLVTELIVFRKNFHNDDDDVATQPDTAPLTDTAKHPFITVRTKDVNTFAINAQLKGVACTANYIKMLIDSDYAKPYNPFVEYFTTRKPWDGKTDYIGQLAKQVQTTDQAFFENSFRHWIVGMVACAINDKVQNQLMMIFHGAQGKGKTTFIRNLLPPELANYYRDNMINSEDKDHALLMSSCLIINIEEFDTLPPWRMQKLKSLITQNVMIERKTWDMQVNTYVRRCSFIASTNNPHCLPDIGQNKRILFNSVIDIDYLTPVKHDEVYAQAYALYMQGYKYWYENDEVTYINNRNEAFRQKDPIEENLFFYYRPATASDGNAHWYPAAQLLSALSANGRTQSNLQSIQMLTTVLESNGFKTRKTSKGVTEYWVVEYTDNERIKNATQPILPEQQDLDLSM